MVRAPCVDKNGMKKGAWSAEEDNKLRDYIKRYGHWNWRELPKFAGRVFIFSPSFLLEFWKSFTYEQIGDAILVL